MPSNEGHIHWTGAADEFVNYLGQQLRITGEVSNADISLTDLRGALRIRLLGAGPPGLLLPTQGWETIPSTSPALEARMDPHYPKGYIRIRQA